MSRWRRDGRAFTQVSGWAKIAAREPTLNTNRGGKKKKIKITDNKQTELLPRLISIQQPSPDCAGSRRGLGKGCTCHAVATDLKMVYIPCYVSITTLTCLRERLTKWRRKRHAATEILFAEQRWKRATHDVPGKHLAEVDCVPSDHIISNYVLLSLRHICASGHLFFSSVWCNSRWGCSSVTLQQMRLRLCSIVQGFFFFWQSFVVLCFPDPLGSIFMDW